MNKRASVFLLAALMAVTAASAAAQASGGAPQAPIVTFKANTRLVVETVSVTGHGEPVTGLTAKNFAITEDGVPQKVAFCVYQRLADQTRPAEANAMIPPPEQVASPTSIRIAPEGPGHSYRGKRLLALYFDMTAMGVSDQLRALSAAGHFVDDGIKDDDLVALLEYNGAGVIVRQDFTSKRTDLQAALGKMEADIGLGLGETPKDADTADTGAAFGQDYSGFNVFYTNRQLAALQSAIEMLAPITEKKSLVYFASGISLQGVDNEAQLESATNAAVRANVALFPVDAQGMTASAPMGDASQGSSGGVAMYNGQAALALDTRRVRMQDSLYALGADTGGKAMLDNNNLEMGIAQARDAIGSYYILGYYPTNTVEDGRYRQVRISLTPARAGAKMAYRTGYYGDKAFAKFNAADKERQLEDALMLGNPITDLNIELEVDAFQLDPNEYFVPVAARIPGSELAARKSGNGSRYLIDFIGEVRDPYGATISNMRDQVKLTLNPATTAALERNGIEFNTGFSLLPGTYQLKLLARDDETGKIGTYIKTFRIANLKAAKAGLPMSTVVLSDQTIPLTQAAYNAKKTQEQSNLNPLVLGGEQVLPSVTRVFHRTSPLTALLYVYEGENGAKPPAEAPLVAYVSFYPEGGVTAAWRSPLQEVTLAPAGDLEQVPVRLRFPLSALKPGKYMCEVAVLQPGTRKAQFWRAPVEIVP